MRNTTWMLMMALAMTIGAAGCGSDDDNSPVAPIDTAPPTVPSGLAVTYDPASFEVVVTWDENTTDHDFDGFLVTRTVSGATADLIDEPMEVTRYVDNVRNVGRDLTYRVYSVDRAGNLSAAAAADLHIDVVYSRSQVNEL